MIYPYSLFGKAVVNIYFLDWSFGRPGKQNLLGVNDMKAKRKLIPAIAMLVVAAVTLTSASYAWFTMSREVTADGIQLTATAPTNLLISSETTWGNTNLKDFAATTTVNLKNDGGIVVGKLMPASSLDGIKLFFPDTISESNGAPTADTTFTQVNADGTSAAGIKDGQPADGYYIDIPLWLKTEGNTDVKVTVNTEKTQIVAGDVAEGKIFTAARFAILNADGAVFPGDNLDGYIVKPAGAKIIDGLKGPITAAGTGGDLFQGTTDDGSKNATGTKELFTVTTDSQTNPVKIIVRLWIEGQDAACIYDNRSHDFKVTLVLSDVDFWTAQP